MDIRKIKKLIELIEDSDITELEIKEGEEAIKLRRGATAVAPVISAPAMPVAPAPSASAAAPEMAIASETTKSSDSSGHDSSGHIVHSPMVGTFYEAPSPDAAPFAKVGQSVKAGETLCIIEAMKMMNQIESDKSGTIQAIHVDNGQPVEFDQPLFTIV